MVGLCRCNKHQKLGKICIGSKFKKFQCRAFLGLLFWVSDNTAHNGGIGWWKRSMYCTMPRN